MEEPLSTATADIYQCLGCDLEVFHKGNGIAVYLDGSLLGSLTTSGDLWINPERPQLPDTLANQMDRLVRDAGVTCV